MARKKNYIALAVVLATLGYLIFTGVRESISYYITPSEFFEEKSEFEGKKLRVGGFVSSVWNDGLDWYFVLTDGKYSMPVTFRGIPPDLFAKAKGAIVEGRWDSQKKIFIAELIMAKHSEEYKPPKLEKYHLKEGSK